MMGSIFAGTDESPGKKFRVKGKIYKQYRGMGSISAMQRGSSDRYFQDNTEIKKLVPEGIEGLVPFKGPLSDTITQLIGGVKSCFGYCGAKNIDDFHENVRLKLNFLI